jgi:hypothetical protein
MDLLSVPAMVIRPTTENGMFVTDVVAAAVEKNWFVLPGTADVPNNELITLAVPVELVSDELNVLVKFIVKLVALLGLIEHRMALETPNATLSNLPVATNM